MILRLIEEADATVPLSDQIKGDEGTQLLMRAQGLYFCLSGDKRPTTVESRAAPWSPPRVPDEMLEIIFNVWVDKLVYAAVRCSREAHAKQLSAGGHLTTVLWMLIQHAGPFCIGEKAKSISFVAAKPKKEEEEKKKKDEEEKKKKKEEEEKKKKEEEEEEKKKDDAKPPPRAPPPPPCCPVCPPYYHPSYPPVCPPYYGPSWPPVCPLYPQCPPQPERTGDETEEAREDKHEYSSSDDDEDSES